MLTTLVVVETIVLCLLAVVVVGLLRSHAEILRRLPEPDDEHDHGDEPGPVVAGSAGMDRAPAVPATLPEPRRRPTQAQDIVGKTLDGDTAVISMASGTDTLLAFLSTGCLTCKGFWDGLQPKARQPMPGGARVVVVVKDPGFESPSKLRQLAPADLPVVHSSRAWDDFGVAMSPYFCFVDGHEGVVRSEGAAMTWEQVRSLLGDALLDDELARGRERR